MFKCDLGLDVFVGAGQCWVRGHVSARKSRKQEGCSIDDIHNLKRTKLLTGTQEFYRRFD